MIIPIEWLKEYIDTDKSPKEIAKTFTALGLMLDKPIENNVLDLEHRMDRADWLSILGCARDFAAMKNLELKTPPRCTERGKVLERGNNIPIVVKCPDLVTRFTTKVIKNVEVKESPKWMQKRLTEYGIPAINNIVDITNYVMVEYGQPLHAQDLDKFEKKEIIIRRAKEGENLTTLDDTNIKLTPEMFILTQNEKPIALGGIVGGKVTAVTSKTTNIILDAGNYNQATIRRTARSLGIRNETVLRSEKFLHPELTEIAIQRAIHLILELAGGDCYDNVDWYPEKATSKVMDLRYSRVEKLGGEQSNSKEIKRIITGLEYEILEQTDRSLKLKVPYFRTDVLGEDDIVADILRLQDYKNIKSKMLAQAPPKNITSPEHLMKTKVRNGLVKIGGNEYITNPLVKKDDLKKVQIELENALTEEQSALRTEIYETLKTIAREYEKQKRESLIFEIGRVYFKKGDKYTEERWVTAIQTRLETQKETHKQLKIKLATLLEELNLKDIHYGESETKGQAKIYQGNLELGYLTVDSFSLSISALLKAKVTPPKLIREHQNESSLDLSLVTPISLSMGKVIYRIKTLDSRIKDVEVLEEYTGRKVGEGNKGILIRLKIGATDLKTKDTKHIQRKTVELLAEEFAIKIR